MTSPTTYEGKAKRVTVRDTGEVSVFFKDDATAFNAQKHQVFPGKGATNAHISATLFDYLHDRGIASHYLRRLDDRTLLCKRAHMISLEVVVRFEVAGSLAKRTGLPPKTPCQPPIIEFYYKRDDLGDPIVNFDHIRMLDLATAEEVAQLSTQGLRTALALRELFERARLSLVDIKFEYVRHDGQLLLADEISPDTCRLHDMASGRVLDKDIFRRDLGDLMAGYAEVRRRVDAAVPPRQAEDSDV